MDDNERFDTEDDFEEDSDLGEEVEDEIEDDEDVEDDSEMDGEDTAEDKSSKAFANLNKSFRTTKAEKAALEQRLKRIEEESGMTHEELIAEIKQRKLKDKAKKEGVSEETLTKRLERQAKQEQENAKLKEFEERALTMDISEIIEDELNIDSRQMRKLRQNESFRKVLKEGLGKTKDPELLATYVLRKIKPAWDKSLKNANKQNGVNFNPKVKNSSKGATAQNSITGFTSEKEFLDSLKK